MTIEELKKNAIENNIPIMQDGAIEYIKRRIKLFNLNKILEIGTAVGYSAVQMASVSDKVHVTTIEKDAERFMMATKNINALEMHEQIDLIFNDALTLDIVDKYNLIVIDAAKGKNTHFFEKYKKNLLNNGFIIIDNINFHGLVGKSETISSKNLRQLVEKIEDFLEYLKTQEDEFYIEIVDEGDGLAVCQRKWKDAILINT